MFQYWLLATGIPVMVKYLFSTSKVAVLPPRRQVTTAAPTFMVLSTPSVLKNSLIHERQQRRQPGRQSTPARR